MDLHNPDDLRDFLRGLLLWAAVLLAVAWGLRGCGVLQVRGLAGVSSPRTTDTPHGP